MNARLKINAAYIYGALIVAGLIGWGVGSWLAFGLTAAAIITLGLYSGDIRPGPSAAPRPARTASSRPRRAAREKTKGSARSR